MAMPKLTPRDILERFCCYILANGHADNAAGMYGRSVKRQVMSKHAKEQDWLAIYNKYKHKKAPEKAIVLKKISDAQMQAFDDALALVDHDLEGYPSGVKALYITLIAVAKDVSKGLKNAPFPDSYKSVSALIGLLNTMNGLFGNKIDEAQIQTALFGRLLLSVQGNPEIVKHLHENKSFIMLGEGITKDGN